MNWDPTAWMAAAWVAALGPAAHIVAIVILLNGAVQSAIHFLQLVIALRELRQRPPVPDTRAVWTQLSEATLPISVLVPAFNEQRTVVETTRSLLSLNYPNFEVIVVNDGSTDTTLETLIGAFELEPCVRAHDDALSHHPIRQVYGSVHHPNLVVADKANGGKADALNAGIDLARMPLFCAVDADSLLEADSLLRVVQPFSEDPINVVAVGGTIRIANGCRVKAGRVREIGLPGEPVVLFQIVEYLRAFLMARLAWSRMGALMLISGAFGIFRRGIAVAVDGYSHGTVGEDMEIIVKIHRYLRDRRIDGEIRFVADPVCWTEAPSSLRVLGRQRRRWQRGSLETFFKHWHMFGRPRYGAAGLLGFPYIFLVDVLGPPTEVVGYVLIPVFWAAGILSLDFMLAFLALTFVFGVFISVGSLVLAEMEIRRYPRPWHLLVLLLAAVIENFGYRQINNFWRIAGYWEFLRRAQGWGRMTRRGFDAG